jgi:hypothetical protein
MEIADLESGVKAGSLLLNSSHLSGLLGSAFAGHHRAEVAILGCLRTLLLGRPVDLLGTAAIPAHDAFIPSNLHPYRSMRYR